MTNLTIWTQSRIKYFEKSSYTESDEQHLILWNNTTEQWHDFFEQYFSVFKQYDIHYAEYKQYNRIFLLTK